MAIVLRPELLAALEQNASAQSRSVNDLVNEAVTRYVRELQHRKLGEEIEAYTRLHSQLAQSYLGQWIAMHHGQIIDRDPDRAALYRRVRARYGRTPVLIRQVHETPDEDLRRRGGSLHSFSA